MAFVEAAATKKIKVYGKPHYSELGSRIRARIWRRVLLGEIALSADAPTVSATPAANRRGDDLWSDPYVFRADLERLVRELAGEGGATGAEADPAEPAPNKAECQRPAEEDAVSADKHNALPSAPALRGNKRKVWEAAQRHGRPDFTKHGDLAAYVRMLAPLYRRAS